MKKLTILISFIFILILHSNIFPQHISVLMSGIDSGTPPYTVTLSDGINQYSKTENSRLIFVPVKDINKKYSILSVTTRFSGDVKNSASIINSKYKFNPPPVLKINYNDNRKMCCCCNENYVQFNLIDKRGLEIQEKIYYSFEMLSKYHKENGTGIYGFITSEQQIELDLNKVEDELIKIYPNYGLEIALGSSYWYQFAGIGMGMKVGSTERNVDLYKNIGNHCSLKCKNICGSCR
jgi:hypothetical protein